MRISDWSSDVCSSDLKFEAPDAVVRSVDLEAGGDETRTVNSREITYFVAPSGTGTGASASDPASFAAALSFYRSRLPSKMTINMATGYYTFAPADFSVNPAGAKTDLTIKHTDGGLSQVDVDLQSGGSIKIGRASCRERGCGYV